MRHDRDNRQEWKSVNENLADASAGPTHSEDGHPLPDTGKVELTHEPEEELDDELTVRADTSAPRE